MKIEKFINELKYFTEYPIWVSVEYFCPKCGQKKYESWEWGDESIFYSPFPWEEEKFNINLEVHEIDPWNPKEWYSWDITVPYEYEEGESCESCEGLIPCEDFAEDYIGEEWVGSVFHHGVTAFNREEDGVQRIIELSTCTDLQICTSTEMIGGYGISVSGDILVAANHDIWSVINENTGQRFFDCWEHDTVSSIEELYNIEGDHNEIVMTNFNIEAIWCKHYVASEIKEALKELATTLGVFFIEVPSRH